MDSAKEEGRMRDEDGSTDEIVELSIDGVLDLHTFQPSEAKELVGDYLAECQKRGITEVRIIHGKGKGVLRRIVQSVLEEHPAVEGYRLGGHGSGSWGATTVDLKPLTPRLRTGR
jgi:DNA-nicking Smr family endonuclease